MAECHTLEVRVPGTHDLMRFHRTSEGAIWVRRFRWCDSRAGFTAAGPARVLSAEDRADLRAALSITERKP